MYNPYNWEIKKKNDKMDELYDLLSQRRAAQTGLTLSIMNLMDDLRWEISGKTCPNVEHDIEMYLQKRKNVGVIDEKIDELF